MPKTLRFVLTEITVMTQNSNMHLHFQFRNFGMHSPIHQGKRGEAKLTLVVYMFHILKGTAEGTSLYAHQSNFTISRH